jgi:hypothetical protein
LLTYTLPPSTASLNQYLDASTRTPSITPVVVRTLILRPVYSCEKSAGGAPPKPLTPLELLVAAALAFKPPHLRAPGRLIEIQSFKLGSLNSSSCQENTPNPRFPNFPIPPIFPQLLASSWNTELKHVWTRCGGGRVHSCAPVHLRLDNPVPRNCLTPPPEP